MCETKKKGHTARIDPNEQLGKKFKIGCLWAVHNCILHPLMSVADCLHGVTKLMVVGCNWLHDNSAPGPLVPLAEIPEDEDDDEDAEEIQQLEDEQRAILGDDLSELDKKLADTDEDHPDPEEEPDAGDLPDEK